jgi:hypothetical protein
LPGTASLRREEIKLQIGLVNALMNTKGYAAPQTKAPLDQARSLIERAEALGEPLEDQLMLFSTLFGLWLANLVASNGDAIRELAAQFLALAEKQSATVPAMIGHRLTGNSLLCTGEIAQGRPHLDRAIARFDPAKHRSLVARFAIDTGVPILIWRSLALWLLGYPEAAVADTDHALKDAREIGHATTLMHALAMTSFTLIHCGNHAAANARADEVVALADEKAASL